MSCRWALFERFDLPDRDGNLYLRRYRLLQTPWFGVYLHKIMQPDADRDLHDHPWNFVSVVLRGGYSEQREDGLFTVRRAGSIGLRLASAAHRVAKLLRVPTWTLVFVGRRLQPWGFHTPTGWREWRDYLGTR